MAAAALASAPVAQAACVTDGTSPCYWTFNSGTSAKNSPNEKVAYPAEGLTVTPTYSESFTGYYWSGAWYRCGPETPASAGVGTAICSNFLSGTLVHALMNTGGSNYTQLAY
jgi:hypothetical protein